METDKKIIKALHEYPIGSIVVSLRGVQQHRREGDMFKVLPNSRSDRLYYKENVCSYKTKTWRKATDEEERYFRQGIRNINSIVRPMGKLPPINPDTDYFIVKSREEYRELFLHLNKGKPIDDIYMSYNVVDRWKYVTYCKDIRGWRLNTTTPYIPVLRYSWEVIPSTTPKTPNKEEQRHTIKGADDTSLKLKFYHNTTINNKLKLSKL